MASLSNLDKFTNDLYTRFIHSGTRDPHYNYQVHIAERNSAALQRAVDAMQKGLVVAVSAAPAISDCVLILIPVLIQLKTVDENPSWLVQMNLGKCLSKMQTLFKDLDTSLRKSPGLDVAVSQDLRARLAACVDLCYGKVCRSKCARVKSHSTLISNRWSRKCRSKRQRRQTPTMPSTTAAASNDL